MIERQTFADHAPAMRRAGWAVLPAVGKSPRVNGFNKWGGAPSIDTVLSWAKRQPNADIIYVPGLCQTPKGKGIVVVDSDDEDAIGQAEELFGKTPAKVRTRRGAHRIFEAAGLDLGKVTSLRPYGLNIDIKHGQEGAGIVVGPPSAHEKDRSIRYAWDDCDETVLKHLPPFPMQALQRILEKKPADTPAPARMLRDGSRKQGVNDYLVSRVCHCADFDELLDVARTWNENLRDHGYEPMEDAILIRRARVVWQQHEQGRFLPMIGQGGVAKTTRSEMDVLLALNPKIAGDALLLLARLKIEHSARCARGKSFALDVRAMARDNVIAGWSRDRYQNAKDLLLGAKSLKCVSEFRMTRDGRDAARYTL